MRIDILDGAEKDLVKGFEFYERQSAGLGEYFLDSIFSDIESLRLYAGTHSLHFGYHRLLAKRFPFAIYYRLMPSSVVRIYAILDCRRNPAWIHSRLK
jgi:hypothetical protein